jgi:hypothetical protein
VAAAITPLLLRVVRGEMPASPGRGNREARCRTTERGTSEPDADGDSQSVEPDAAGLGGFSSQGATCGGWPLLCARHGVHGTALHPGSPKGGRTSSPQAPILKSTRVRGGREIVAESLTGSSPKAPNPSRTAPTRHRGCSLFWTSRGWPANVTSSPAYWARTGRPSVGGGSPTGRAGSSRPHAGAERALRSTYLGVTISRYNVRSGRAGAMFTRGVLTRKAREGHAVTDARRARSFKVAPRRRAFAHPNGEISLADSAAGFRRAPE